jgi:hypothetical protein
MCLEEEDTERGNCTYREACVARFQALRCLGFGFAVSGAIGVAQFRGPLCEGGDVHQHPFDGVRGVPDSSITNGGGIVDRLLTIYPRDDAVATSEDPGRVALL